MNDRITKIIIILLQDMNKKCFLLWLQIAEERIQLM